MDNAKDFWNQWPEPDGNVCPTEDILVEISKGKRDEKWSDHVAACPNCSRVVSTLKFAESRRSRGLNEFIEAVALQADENLKVRKPSLWGYLKGFYTHRGWSVAIPIGAMAAFGGFALISWPRLSLAPSPLLVPTTAQISTESAAAQINVDQLVKLAQSVRTGHAGDKPTLLKARQTASAVEANKKHLTDWEKAVAVDAEFTIKVEQPAYVAVQPETMKLFDLYTDCRKDSKPGCEKMPAAAFESLQAFKPRTPRD